MGKTGVSGSRCQSQRINTFLLNPPEDRKQRQTAGSNNHIQGGADGGVAWQVVFIGRVM